MKIVIAGGSGYLGTLLAEFYKSKAEVVILTRGKDFADGNIRYVHWDAKTIGGWSRELEGCSMLINLTGKNVNCRYTEKNKREILDSRIDSTRVLGNVVRKLQQPPALWVQSASATIYRDSKDVVMTEETGQRGLTFSEMVCRQWEKTFEDIVLPQTRKAVLRIGIVLGTSDSALSRLMNLAKIGFGGFQGNGRQFVSWVHERDVVNAIEWLRTLPTEAGTFNVTAPEFVTNRVFMKALRKEMRVLFGIPIPKVLLAFGAAIIGTETELVLKSRKVYPQRLLDDGFVFEFPDLKSALVDLCQREKRS